MYYENGPVTVCSTMVDINKGIVCIYELELEPKRFPCRHANFRAQSLTINRYIRLNVDLRTVLVVYLSVPFLLKSSYRLYPLMYFKMLETVCLPPLTGLICEIKTLLILWKY